MIGGILALISQSVVDTWFVSRLGTDALSALSFTFPVIMAVSSIAIGLGAGAASVAARTIGAGDTSRVRREATDSLVLSALIGLSVAFLGLATVETVFGRLGAQGTVLELVGAYMDVWYLGLAFVVVPMVGNGLIRAAGDARIPGLIMMSAALLNLIFDPLLIFGIGPFPELGLQGAAVATVIANLSACCLGLWALQFRERMIVWAVPPLTETLDSWKRVLQVGVPAAGANMINPLGVAAITAMLATFGKEAVAAFGVATRIEMLAGVAMFALSSSIGPVVGQNWGRGEFGRVTEALRLTIRFNLAYGVGLAALLALLGPFIARLFSDTEAVAGLATVYLWIVPITLAGYGINIVGAAALNAIGLPLIAVMLTFVRMALIYIPLALLLGRWLGPPGVFAAGALANIVAGFVTVRVCRARLQPTQAVQPS